MGRLRTAFLLGLLLTFVALPAARAQTPDLAARLPADTLFYMYWRGASSLKPGSQNALVSLWNDPGFQPARQLILQGLVEAAARNPRLARIPSGDIEALLADPFVFGIRLPARGASADSGKRPTANGFLVVQAAGEAGRDLRADLENVSNGTVNLRFTATGLLLASNDPATLDELARQFGASEPVRASFLSTTTAYRESRAEIAGEPPVEFFLRVPEASSLGPEKTPSFNTGVFLRSLHMERVHLLCGSIDLDQPAAFVHFAILGDTSPGSLFDLFGANVASFSTLAAAPVGASISIHRFDIGAVLSLLTGALSAATGPDQSARLSMISGLLSGTVVPALGGEYATIWPGWAAGNGASLLVLTVNQPAAQTLFTTTLAPFLKADGQEGEIRYFRLGGRSMRAGNHRAEVNSTGARGEPSADGQSALIALTPHLVLASKDEALLRRSARAVTAASPAPGLADEPRFRAARAELPATLSGLSYFDLENFIWTHWIAQMATGMEKDKKDQQVVARGEALEKWNESGGGAVLAHHLHLFVAGAWKDNSGIHWRGDIH